MNKIINKIKSVCVFGQDFLLNLIPENNPTKRNKNKRTEIHRIHCEISPTRVQKPVSRELHVSMPTIARNVNAQRRDLKVLFVIDSACDRSSTTKCHSNRIILSKHLIKARTQHTEILP